ncbi:ComEA family DNA-binding protein [Pseudomonas japonica]|uniref:ComEA family DNA-binding protein n=1 Tax=Pseudomonas japonica TaxID=256466 RepID=UPI0015E2F32F|nr:ComEA family DNA-binding protein [Pseudomonas japonica]MBA1241976.1 helix-hairpin-helix domain-containing protein [Pseudomonas japonica]MBA1288759.1 helix-hairpin-helix domain-containing protein [Pseudomonas japonica]
MRKTILSSILLAALAITPLAAQANTTSTAPTPSAAAMAQSLVNLNTADATTLQKELAGIGAAKAQAIVAFREQNGAFTSVDELLEVQGIGKSLLDKNRDRLAVK